MVRTSKFQCVSYVMVVMAMLVLLGATPGFCGGKVNINAASKSELQTLSGIGTVKAERIINYRQDHPFENKKEILEVKGVGEKTYAKIKSKIYVE